MHCNCSIDKLSNLQIFAPSSPNPRIALYAFHPIGGNPAASAQPMRVGGGDCERSEAIQLSIIL
jgi:hypothetical protein